MLKIIKHVSLDHLGGYYHYRVHNFKAKSLCSNYPELATYLDRVFKECPHNYFESGPRSSSLRFKIDNLDIKRVKNHEVCELTSLGLKENHERYLTSHSKVQVFMLENDDKTIAIERMRQEGAIISSMESILFELTRISGTETFKAISKLVKA